MGAPAALASARWYPYVCFDFLWNRWVPRESKDASNSSYRRFRCFGNPNFILHSYGIPVAIAVAFLATYGAYWDMVHLSVLKDALSSSLPAIAFGLSFPAKSLLRWLFPYVEFQGENKLRIGILRTLKALMLGVMGNGLWAVMQLLVKAKP